jgi:hypothetical protein
MIYIAQDTLISTVDSRIEAVNSKDSVAITSYHYDAKEPSNIHATVKEVTVTDVQADTVQLYTLQLERGDLIHTTANCLFLCALGESHTVTWLKLFDIPVDAKLMTIAGLQGAKPAKITMREAVKLTLANGNALVANGFFIAVP